MIKVIATRLILLAALFSSLSSPSARAESAATRLGVNLGVSYSTSGYSGPPLTIDNLPFSFSFGAWLGFLENKPWGLRVHEDYMNLTPWATPGISLANGSYVTSVTAARKQDSLSAELGAALVLTPTTNSVWATAAPGFVVGGGYRFVERLILDLKLLLVYNTHSPNLGNTGLLATFSPIIVTSIGWVF